MSASVFISSTSRDLRAHRAAVAKALLDAGFHPVDMANFMARPAGAVEACLSEVAEADLFIGLYAWRYGHVPDGAEESITEQEFIEAEKLGKPCFCFMVDETYNWPDEHKETGVGAERLRAFKARIEAKLVRATFTTPADLAEKVLASLHRWKPEKAGQAPPFTAPRPPDHFVERPAEFEALLEQLLATATAASVIGIQGGGGFGKTTLATVLCHDPR